MASQVVRSDSHANKLVSAVGDLYNSKLFCDAEVRVGTATFQCHRLVLVMQSSYFKERFFPTSSETAKLELINVDDVLPDDFENILGFLYRGEIELNRSSVGRMLRLSKLFCLEALSEMCLQYIREILDISTSVEYWEIAGSEEESELRLSCVDKFVENFNQLTEKDIQLIPQDMMKAAIQRDDLTIDNEQQLCEVLLKWFDASRINEQRIELLSFLSEVRWSGVSIGYIKSNLISNEIVRNDPLCVEWLSRVISYRLTGIQFPGLLTHHRPSTELETSVVIFGTDEEIGLTRNCYRISLQKQKGVHKIADLPTDMSPEISACLNNNAVFITGLGEDRKGTWRWDLTSGWTRCGDMVEGRRRHFTTFIDETSMYALGGWSDKEQMVLSSVEQYNRVTNKWKTVGTLSQCVASAGGVAYKSSIYLFGGEHFDVSTNQRLSLDCIQEYDTTKRSEPCTFLTQRLPQSMPVLRAALWDETVIIMNSDSSAIFNLKENTIQQRNQFKSGVEHFGVVVDNQTLFVIGGGTSETDSSGEIKWTITDEVKSVPVMDIINNKQTVTWSQHTKLTSPSCIFAFGLVTLDRCCQ